MTVHCRIRSSAKTATGHEAVFEFEDNGDGIDPADIPHIFEQFYRKAEGYVEGSGLGLAIVKGIIEQHGGEVGAHNKKEAGAVFSFTLTSIASFRFPARRHSPSRPPLIAHPPLIVASSFYRRIPTHRRILRSPSHRPYIFTYPGSFPFITASSALNRLIFDPCRPASAVIEHLFPARPEPSLSAKSQRPGAM